MASVLAIVSKAVFEKLAASSVAVGDRIETDRYAATPGALEQLTDGDAIFLVTVRPPNEALWLVAILEQPKQKGKAWLATPNTTRIADVTGVVKNLQLATGKGITAKKGALGISLQTPRPLSDADVALLRSAAQPSAAVKAFDDAFTRLSNDLGKSKERYRLFDELTPLQQTAVRETATKLDPNLSLGNLEALGLPPYPVLARWAGLASATVLEQRAGKWPVWKWLKAATLDEVTHEAAIKALAKGLHATQLRDLVWRVSTAGNDYDLWAAGLKARRGESAATRYTAQVIRLLGALVDAAGLDVALTFAERAENHLAKHAEFWLAAVASFGLVARARRRGEPFPKRFYALARKCDYLGYGVLLREAFRDIVALVPMIDREAFVIDEEPHFLTSCFEELKGGREVEVPCLLHDWLIADLVPTPRMAEALVADMASWPSGPQPKKEALAVISAMGSVCAPYLEKAVKKSKSPHKAVLGQALRLVGDKTRRRA